MRADRERLQTVSAQVVYENDKFSLQYGVEDKLEHRPALDNRGKPIGAFVVFKYKDGGYSFDFMSTADIEKIRERSKASGLGEKDSKKVPWVTDWDEMAKKTVIKRHAKLAPLSVEFQKAAALEERAFAGESQADLLGMDDDIIDTTSSPDLSESVKKFDAAIPPKIDLTILGKYLQVCAAHFKKSLEEVKAGAAENMPGFLEAFEKWVKLQGQKEQVESPKRGRPEGSKNKPKEMALQENAGMQGNESVERCARSCPVEEEAGRKIYQPKSVCDACGSRDGCPAWQ